ncbi:hypothetical protein GXW78_09015 [Roseomonas terrae]|jgi:hypothetical protein|uniref:CcmD family protein n=1 Tax=Neoroseomonas terrae TaxID=424799 RepID=A0ABS5EFJ9_9PROT|nr:hypothetical protein [Neoroseomonas terrae]MBR0649801.1 hypothetical protein [Neoroseomonas terrae]
MILVRILQAVGVAGLLACANLAWESTPWGGEAWNRNRMLYAWAGAIPALALLGIASMIATLRRQTAEIAALRETLARIEGRLGA